MEKNIDIYRSPLYIQDLKFVIRNTKILEQFSGTSILITGATGLICSGVVDLLLFYNELFLENETNENPIQLYIAGRNEKKIRKRFSGFADKGYFHFVPYDANKRNAFHFKADYIIHGAGNAYPAVIQEKPVETMLDNFQGLYELLTYAKRHRVKNTLFISSSEVYGEKSNTEPFGENEYGFVDILNPRSSYSSGKRAAETLCASFSYERDICTTIIRPGHIYGPTASKADNRVSSMFAFEAAYGNNLILKSEGAQIRSYCYVLDSATSILTVLLCGESGTAYNISNPDSIITIRQIAELYAEHGGVQLMFDLPNDTEKASFNPMSNSSLNSSKLQSLGWKGLFSAETGTEHTVKIIREAINNG